MIRALAKSFKIPELKRKILFTIGAIAVFRVGAYVPIPGINAQALAQFFESKSGTLFSLMNMFSGGAMQRATVFALGIMPYISASIIIQLLTAVIPYFEKLAREPGVTFFSKSLQMILVLTVGPAIQLSPFVSWCFS